MFRFAPSPNGHLHLGHALSALLNREAADRAGLPMALRLEDIDRARCTRELERDMLEDLAWLGIDWDGAVVRQSERFALYGAALADLRRRGLVYPAFMSRGEVRARLTPDWPRDPDGAPLYPPDDRELPAAERERRVAAGAPHTWRLDTARALAGTGPLDWREGEDTVAADPLAWGDPVLARRDVPTSYHLAVVVDDAAQGVTQVVRGRDLFHSTAVHALLQRLLGLPQPRYTHHPLVLDADGSKLSKSGGSTSLRALREGGATPADIRKMVEPFARRANGEDDQASSGAPAPPFTKRTAS